MGLYTSSVQSRSAFIKMLLLSGKSFTRRKIRLKTSCRISALFLSSEKLLPDSNNFKKIQPYQYLAEYGDLERAVSYAKQLYTLAQQTPEDLHSYTQIHELLELLESIAQ